MSAETPRSGSRPLPRPARAWWWAGAWALGIALLSASANDLRAYLVAVGLRERLARGVVVLVPVALAGLAWAYRRARPRLVEVVASTIIGLVAAALVLALGQHFDERMHLVTFAPLGFAVTLALLPDHGLVRGVPLALLLVVAAGFGDEVLQGLLPHRYYDPRDIVMNAVAGFAGLAFAMPLAARPRVPRPIGRGVAPAALATVGAIVLGMTLAGLPLFPAGTLVGTWLGQNDCTAEWLTLAPSGDLAWRDADDHRASGRWQVQSNGFGKAVLELDVRASRNASPCGLKAPDPATGHDGIYRAPVAVRDGALVLGGISSRRFTPAAGSDASAAAGGAEATDGG